MKNLENNTLKIKKIYDEFQAMKNQFSLGGCAYYLYKKISLIEKSFSMLADEVLFKFSDFYLQLVR